MPYCILHVGTPKTGTSSIQESLYFGLSDPRFHFLSMGLVNPALMLMLLFSDKPEEFWILRRSKCPAARIAVMKRRYAVRLRRALSRARARSQTPIISAECCWRQPESFFRQLQDFLANEGFGVRIVVYLRPIKSFVESRFQQMVLHGQQSFEPLAPTSDTGVRVYRYAQRLEMLERVFGSPNIVVRPFTRAGLAGGCSVRDFCSISGIRLDPRSIIRSNEGSSLDAVRLMFAYNRYRSNDRTRSVFDRVLFVQRIKSLRGAPLKFHSSVMAPCASEIATDERLVRERYSVDISEDWCAFDDGPCIRREADLFTFSQASREWLSHVSGLPPVTSHEGEAAAREVALQMQRVRRQPYVSGRLQRLHANARRHLRWISHGD